MDNKQKKKQQERSMANSVIFWLLGLGLFDTALWLIPLLGNSWHSKQFTGFGIKYLSISTSLLHQTVNFDCGKNLIEDQVCRIVSLLEGRHSLLAAKGLSCSLSTQACDVMSELYMTSFIPFFGFLTAAVFQILGVVFLYSYWRFEPVAKVRQWALSWFMAAAATGTTSFLLFTVLSPNLSDLPRGWMSVTADIGFMQDVFGIKPVDEMPYGWCYFGALFSIAFSMATVLAWMVFFNQHSEEHLCELVKENNKIEMAEQVANMQYSAELGERSALHQPLAQTPMQMGR